MSKEKPTPGTPPELKVLYAEPKVLYTEENRPPDPPMVTFDPPRVTFDPPQGPDFPLISIGRTPPMTPPHRVTFAGFWSKNSRFPRGPPGEREILVENVILNFGV